MTGRGIASYPFSRDSPRSIREIIAKRQSHQQRHAQCDVSVKTGHWSTQKRAEFPHAGSRSLPGPGTPLDRPPILPLSAAESRASPASAAPDSTLRSRYRNTRRRGWEKEGICPAIWFRDFINRRKSVVTRTWSCEPFIFKVSRNASYFLLNGRLKSEIRELLSEKPYWNSNAVFSLQKLLLSTPFNDYDLVTAL